MATSTSPGLDTFAMELTTTPENTETKPLVVPLVLSLCLVLLLLLVAAYFFWRWKTGRKVFPFSTICKARPVRKKVSIEIPDSEMYSEIVDRKKISMKTPVNSSKSISIINDNQKHYNTNLAFVGDNSEDYFSDFQADIDDFYIVLEKDSTLFPSTKELKLELMHDIMLDDISLKGADANEHFDEVSPKNQNNVIV
ncbi:uncharacterized protein LOC106882844 [Octopus bimaculoides]|uniref:Uncharacterized protein n=1 Tax=Octopus bimaculoides TaxID=37653 RepID=A0A0L8FK56_OCTBM|nr:uncharacterized protein LOC106882844 [Octopus bimaculoides]XP_014789132.1 uncharacterized protein LOC106882844 [Octopus bimaculoides]XP_014789133.1 uncharacterized protein LOC106882844 [Octopus bimaculoides]XP_014789134.1 uncharacterized protein LOC106882844 [Octopus bimaculoides]XP_052824110.1 uncharacterized protein LOC106882844 [Octopus bimaculoides]XP_052824111.1 uncharacterized protein LOC106882844 [Octopus bimaculoides]|eukprot:XP_014789131.1 PREDICTED: uncharacterized protein LOC106882844 [Octopus bimaculoides]